MTDAAREPPAPPVPPAGRGARVVVVMGVSGCGKSTVGAGLAQALQMAFIEGDSYHSPANVARMAAGIALTDADRHDWLEALSDQIGNAVREGRGLVLACSALKRAYRAVLGRHAPDLLLVYLAGDRALLEQRTAQRSGHYMPPSLLDSQLATLEPPGDDENVVCVDLRERPQAIVQALLAHPRLRHAAAPGTWSTP